MAQEYFTDNLVSRFIKCLLWDMYIPTVDIWKPGKRIIKHFTYITNDKYIVKASRDYPNDIDETGPKSALDSAYFKIVDNYIEGKFYRGITSNFNSNSSLYDPDTHYMLGQYLRYLRDMYDLDLMAYYNCYSGESSDNLRINPDSTIKTDNNINDGLVSYIVPIKFNQTYSIYYQSDVPFYILPVYYNGVNIWNVKTDSNTKLPRIQVNRSSIKSPYIFKPITFKGDDLVFDKSNARLIEDYLALLIQVPKNEYSNLLVLEGNYSNNKLNLNMSNNSNLNILSKQYVGNLDIDLNQVLKPYSSLTENITNINYAFNDRLVEYLLYSPIINKDRIRYNIKRVQDKISSKNFKDIFPYTDEKTVTEYDNTMISDIWDNSLRYYLYNFSTQNSNKKLYKDINGFVDKDTESLLDKVKTSEGKWNV